jgi:hypothetical protein
MTGMRKTWSGNVTQFSSCVEMVKSACARCQGDGWLLAKLVACMVDTGSFLGPNPDNSQKYKMGDISKGVAKTLLPAN